MILHWSLSDSKSPQVFRTLLNILADLINTVVWVVSTRPLISNSSSSFTRSLRIVQSAPVTIDIMLTFMFHSVLSSLAKSWNLYFFPLSLVVCRDGKVHYLVVFLFFFFFFFFFLSTITWSGRLARIRWPVCISKSQRILYISFSRTVSSFCIYHLFVESNFNFLRVFHTSFFFIKV